MCSSLAEYLNLLVTADHFGVRTIAAARVRLALTVNVLVLLQKLRVVSSSVRLRMEDADRPCQSLEQGRGRMVCDTLNCRARRSKGAACIARAVIGRRYPCDTQNIGAIIIPS